VHEGNLGSGNAVSSSGPEGVTRTWETYTLLEDFSRVLMERKVEALRSWLEHAARSLIAPLRGLARSVK